MTLRLEHQAEITVCFDKIRLQSEGMLEMHHSVSKSSLCLEQYPQITMSLGIIRPEVYGLAVMLQGHLELALLVAPLFAIACCA